MKKLNKLVKGIAVMTLAFTVLATSNPTAVYASNITTVKDLTQSDIAKGASLNKATDILNQVIKSKYKTHTIPGLKQTVSKQIGDKSVHTYSNYVPQGITKTVDGKYVLISAYSPDKHASVIYVIETKGYEYKTTLILGDKSPDSKLLNMHAGGIACDSKYIWVGDTTSNVLRAYEVGKLSKAVKHQYWTVYDHHDAKSSTLGSNSSPSYLCYANGKLYAGHFSEKDPTSTIYAYTVSGAKYTKASNTITVNNIKAIQGISIKDNKLIVTSSHGRDKASTVYAFNNANNFNGNVTVNGNSPAKKYTFANMVEQCYITKENVYFIFESGAKTYRFPKSNQKESNLAPYSKYIAVDRSAFY